MDGIVFTYGFIALNDTQTEDTDKPTNPWLELILESNKNEKEPSKLRNLVQDLIQNIKDEIWIKNEADRNRDFHVANQFLRRLIKARQSGRIDFSQLNLRVINFSNARFVQPAIFSGAKFDGHMSFQ